jgi:hypothetical protein
VRFCEFGSVKSDTKSGSREGGPGPVIYRVEGLRDVM